MTPRERRHRKYLFGLFAWMIVATLAIALTRPIAWIMPKGYEFTKLSNFMNAWSLKCEQGLWRNRPL